MEGIALTKMHFIQM